MDEIEMVRSLLTERAPTAAMADRGEQQLARLFAAEAGHAAGQPPGGASVVRLNSRGHAIGRPPLTRRWGIWLTPVAAAVAVTAVVAGTLTVGGAVGRHQARTNHARTRPGPNPAAAVARAGAPRYFVALDGGGAVLGGTSAVAGLTATGQVLGSVRVPTPGTLFTQVAAADDDRTYVLAVQQNSNMPRGGTGPARLYRLRLDRSGQPGRLTALPLAPVTGVINGFALSPDGSKLAISTLPPLDGSAGSALEICSVSTGAVKTWRWPGTGAIGWDKPDAQSLSWQADNRTLLFLGASAKPSSRGGSSRLTHAYLLDTAAHGSDLLRASRQVPIPGQQMSGTSEAGVQISGPMLITGDGTTIVAPTKTVVVIRPALPRNSPRARQLRQQSDRLQTSYRTLVTHHASAQVRRRAMVRLEQAFWAYQNAIWPTDAFVVAITEFSVRTGRPVRTVDRESSRNASVWTQVRWAGASGSSLIVTIPANPGTSGAPQPVTGIQDGGTFTPLPRQLQGLLGSAQIAW